MWGYDLATVDCRQPHSTCHCLQRFRQFESSASTECTRGGAERVGVSCGAEGVLTEGAPQPHSLIGLGLVGDQMWEPLHRWQIRLHWCKLLARFPLLMAQSVRIG